MKNTQTQISEMCFAEGAGQHLYMFTNSRKSFNQLINGFCAEKKVWVLSCGNYCKPKTDPRRASGFRGRLQRIQTHLRLSPGDPGFPGPAGVIFLPFPVLLCSTQLKFNDPLTSFSTRLHSPSSLEVTSPSLPYT